MDIFRSFKGRSRFLHDCISLQQGTIRLDTTRKAPFTSNNVLVALRDVKRQPNSSEANVIALKVALEGHSLIQNLSRRGNIRLTFQMLVEIISNALKHCRPSTGIPLPAESEECESAML